MNKSWDRANKCKVTNITKSEHLGLMLEVESENNKQTVTIKDNEVNCTCHYKTVHFNVQNKFCKHVIAALDFLKNNKGCFKNMGDVFCGQEETEWDSRHGILIKYIYYCKDCTEKIIKQKKKNE